MTLFSLMKTADSMLFDVVHRKAQFAMGDALNHTNEGEKKEKMGWSMLYQWLWIKQYLIQILCKKRTRKFSGLSGILTTQ